MDNISHSLTGLALGELVDRSIAPESDPVRARVRRRLLLTLCWVASNFPDIDLLFTPLAPRPLGYLLQHRGHTHTLPGLVPQALLLLALFWLLWPQARTLLRESSRVRAATAAVLAGGLLLHLGMDYLNVYGVHPFYPFDARWVYGDMVFIVEPVFWVAFGAPLAMLSGPGLARRVGMALLAAVPVMFTALGFLQWGSLAGLAALGLLLAWLQLRAGDRGRTALAAAFAAAALFVAGQGLAVRSARAIVAAQPRQGRLLDAALTAFPSNPLCWSVVAIEQDDAAGMLTLRRGLLSLAPGLVPAASCPPRIAGTVAPAAVLPPVAWQWAQAVPLASLRALRRKDCAFDAWLRFSRAPALVGGSATDARYGLPGGPNFSTMQFNAPRPCRYPVPGWGYPRADVLEGR